MLVEHFPLEDAWRVRLESSRGASAQELHVRTRELHLCRWVACRAQPNSEQYTPLASTLGSRARAKAYCTITASPVLPSAVITAHLLQGTTVKGKLVAMLHDRRSVAKSLNCGLPSLYVILTRVTHSRNLRVLGGDLSYLHELRWPEWLILWNRFYKDGQFDGSGLAAWAQVRTDQAHTELGSIDNLGKLKVPQLQALCYKLSLLTPSIAKSDLIKSLTALWSEARASAGHQVGASSAAAGADNTAQLQLALDELKRKNQEKRAEIANKRSAALAALELSNRTAAEARASAAEAAEQRLKTRNEETAERKLAEARRKEQARIAALAESAQQVAALPGGRGGMANVGNSCFVNSVVQALLAVPGFGVAVASARAHAGLARAPGLGEETRAALARALYLVWEEMRTSVGGCGAAASGQLAKAAWAAMGRARGSQQDACEFFLRLLDSLDTPLFMLQRRQLVTCIPLRGLPHTHALLASEPNILLALPPPIVPGRDLGLQALLEAHFLQVEDIDYRCHRDCAHEASADADRLCNLAHPNNTTRAEATFKYPDAYGGSVVCVCLRRFGSTHFGNRKNKSRVGILEYLLFPQDNVAVPLLTGTLVAAVLHLGETTDSGHFVTLARPRPRSSADGEVPSQECWLYFNDGQIDIRTDDFLQSDQVAQNAWMLFYHLRCVQPLLSL